MKLKSIEEMKEFRNKEIKIYQEKNGKGKEKHWGDGNIPEFIKAKGKILFADNFNNFDNWHHEGIGELTTPEPGVMQINCIGSKQGGEGCMAFCRKDFPDNICIEYDMKTMTTRGLLITFIAAQGRHGEDIITGLPPRPGIFANYIYNPDLRCYHVSVSRYNDKGEHTNTSNWRRNPGAFTMNQGEDLCKTPQIWYHIAIVKRGKLLQMEADGKKAGGFIDRDEIPEPIPAAGKVGFRVIGADVVAQIRNFKVTALE